MTAYAKIKLVVDHAAPFTRQSVKAPTSFLPFDYLPVRMHNSSQCWQRCAGFANNANLACD
jgi:hypothetical protein